MVTLAMSAAQERRRQPVGEEEQDYATLARAGGRKGELATPSLCGLSEAGLVVLQKFCKTIIIFVVLLLARARTPGTLRGLRTQRAAVCYTTVSLSPQTCCSTGSMRGPQTKPSPTHGWSGLTTVFLTAGFLQILWHTRLCWSGLHCTGHFQTKRSLLPGAD